MPDTRKIEMGKTYVIRSFTDRELAIRMLYMGIQPGQYLEVLGRSPFGRCYYISVGDRWVAMRDEELAALDLEEAGPAQEQAL